MKVRNLKLELQQVLADARRLQAKADQIEIADLQARTALLALRISTLRDLLAGEN